MKIFLLIILSYDGKRLWTGSLNIIFPRLVLASYQAKRLRSLLKLQFLKRSTVLSTGGLKQDLELEPSSDHALASRQVQAQGFLTLSLLCSALDARRLDGATYCSLYRWAGITFYHFVHPVPTISLSKSSMCLSITEKVQWRELSPVTWTNKVRAKPLKGRRLAEFRRWKPDW